MGAPVVKSTNGYGLPVTVVATGGLPVALADNGYGTPIIEVAQGGLPITYDQGGGVAVQNAFASSRLRFADRSVTLSATFFSALFRIPAITPNRTLKNPRVFIPGFAANNSGASPTERQVNNDFIVGYGIEVTGQLPRKRATFGAEGNWTTRGGTGASKGWPTSYDVGKLSDPIKNADGSDLVLLPNTVIYHCSIVRIANAGEVYPASQYLNSGGVCRNSTDPTGAPLEALLTNSSAISTSGSAPSLSFAPAYMVAEDTESGELVSVLLSGDSRFYGVGDFATGLPAAQYGLQSGQRAMLSLGLPHGNISIPGSTPYADCAHRYAAVNEIKRVYGKYSFTRGVGNHGNNGDQSIAGIQYELAQLKAAFPDPTIKWGKTTLPPRIGTGGDYRTTAGQTPAAADTYPSGQRAILNNYILANASAEWDFVIDLGLYGSAAKGLAGNDPNFNDYRSKFPVGPSYTLGAAWNNNQQVFMTDGSLLAGDLISMGASFVRANIAGPVTGAAVDQGNGTWRSFFENGGYPNTSYASGDPATRVASGDGTHEGPWVAILESQSIIEWFNAGMPSRYPVAA